MLQCVECEFRKWMTVKDSRAVSNIPCNQKEVSLFSLWFWYYTLISESWLSKFWMSYVLHIISFFTIISDYLGTLFVAFTNKGCYWLSEYLSWLNVRDPSCLPLVHNYWNLNVFICLLPQNPDICKPRSHSNGFLTQKFRNGLPLDQSWSRF